jgi:hypothetical protein
MEQVHEDLIQWLEEKNANGETIIRIGQFLAGFLAKLEQGNLTASNLLPVPQNLMIYMPLHTFK